MDSSGILPYAGTAAAALGAYFGNRGLKMRDLGQNAAEWTCYSIGLTIVVFPAVLWASTEPEMIGQQRILLGVLGALAGGAIAIACGEWVRPSIASAQTPSTQPSVNCSNSVGGNNSSPMENNCGNTFNIGPQRLQFSNELGSQLLAKMTIKKKVKLLGVGNNTDQIVVRQIKTFLEESGYEVDIVSISMMVPAPDHKIDLLDSNDTYVLTVAPSAN